jgi:excisionase family DNA binding protein
MTTPLLLKVTAAAELLASHPDTIRAMIADGRLPGVHVGRTLRVPTWAVHEYASTGRVDPDSAAKHAGAAGIPPVEDFQMAHLIGAAASKTTSKTVMTRPAPDPVQLQIDDLTAKRNNALREVEKNAKPGSQGIANAYKAFVAQLDDQICGLQGKPTKRVALKMMKSAQLRAAADSTKDPVLARSFRNAASELDGGA